METARRRQRSIHRFPAIDLNRSGLAQLDRDDARRRISAEEQLVFLEIHQSSQIAPDFARIQNARLRLTGLGASPAVTKLQPELLPAAHPVTNADCYIVRSYYFPSCCERLARSSKRRNQIADCGAAVLLAIYKDLHTHPELSTHEERSADRREGTQARRAAK